MSEEGVKRGRLPRRGDVKAQIFSNIKHSLSEIIAESLTAISHTIECIDDQSPGSVEDHDSESVGMAVKT